jgi:hypothetical protein
MRIAALFFLAFAFLLQGSQANAKVRLPNWRRRRASTRSSWYSTPSGTDGSGALAGEAGGGGTMGGRHFQL